MRGWVGGKRSRQDLTGCIKQWFSNILQTSRPPITPPLTLDEQVAGHADLRAAGQQGIEAGGEDEEGPDLRVGG